MALGGCGPAVVVGMVVAPILGTKAWGSMVLFMSIAPGFDWPIETAAPFAWAAAGKKASKIAIRRLRGEVSMQLFCDIRTEPALNAPFM